jgi:hypothetical protein
MIFSRNLLFGEIGMTLKDKPECLVVHLSSQTRCQVLNNLSFELLLSHIFLVVEMNQVCIDFAFETLLNLLISHVGIHDRDSMPDFKFFIVELLNDLPYLVEGVCEKQATSKLHKHSISNFIGIFGCNIPIANRNHCCRCPVE